MGWSAPAAEVTRYEDASLQSSVGGRPVYCSPNSYIVRVSILSCSNARRGTMSCQESAPASSKSVFVNLMREAGVSERLDKEGFVHDGTVISFGNEQRSVSTSRS